MKLKIGEIERGDWCSRACPLHMRDRPYMLDLKIGDDVRWDMDDILKIPARAENWRRLKIELRNRRR